MNHAAIHIAPPDADCAGDHKQPSSFPPLKGAAATDASSANGARQPVAASQGRRAARQDGSCPCAMDCGGAPFPGLFVHHRTDCAVYQAIVADPHARVSAMACAMLTAQSALRLYANIARHFAPELSMRQCVGDLDNTRAVLDAIERQVRFMKNDMPVVAQRGGTESKGANPQ